MQHPRALAYLIRLCPQLLRAGRPELAVTGPEHDGHDIPTHLVDQGRCENLAADIPHRDFNQAVTGQLFRRGHGGREAVDEVEGDFGMRRN